MGSAQEKSANVLQHRHVRTARAAATGAYLAWDTYRSLADRRFIKAAVSAYFTLYSVDTALRAQRPAKKRKRDVTLEEARTVVTEDTRDFFRVSPQLHVIGAIAAAAGSLFGRESYRAFASGRIADGVSSAMHTVYSADIARRAEVHAVRNVGAFKQIKNDLIRHGWREGRFSEKFSDTWCRRYELYKAGQDTGYEQEVANFLEGRSWLVLGEGRSWLEYGKKRLKLGKRK